MKVNQKRALTFSFLILCLLAIFIISALYDQPVNFMDYKLELAVREILHHYDKPVFRSQLLGIVELDLSNREISRLEGIEHFRNLEVLNLRFNQISDVSPLESLNSLRVLDLGYNRIVDLQEANFGHLHKVRLIDLNLDHNVRETSTSGKIRLSDLELLRQFNSLIYLSLEDNHIENVEPLSALTNLKELILIENRLVNLDGLETLTQLKKLNLRENQLEDISAIYCLNNLRYLNLHSNPNLRDISPLQNLVDLETLILRNVPVAEQISVLENMTRLQRLNLRNTAINDISVLVRLMESGALQDDPENQVFAYLDLFENGLSNNPWDLRGLKPYWDKIAVKYPAFLNDSVLPEPRVSKEGGFYQESIAVELYSEMNSAEIRYTLDGSIPGRDSLLYEKPILLAGLANNSDEVLPATVLRARLFLIEGFDTSPTVTHTYFIGQNSMNIYSLPVVSLATDYDNFFDPELGIYENFRERGKKWERPIHIEYFGQDKTLAFTKEAQVRIHGSATRGLAQKSLRFYGENDAGDLPYFDYEFFPGYIASGREEPLKVFDSLLFRNSGNDYRFTFFKDAVIQRLVAHTKLDIQAYQPVNVYINGRYWGIYNIRERLDKFYLKNHYHLNPDEITIHKIVADVDFFAQQPDANEFLSLREFILQNDVTDDGIFEYVSTKIDLENFIDNQIIYIYAANGDWLKNNVMFWRKNVKEFDPDAQPGHDGRWRWMVIDMDLGFRDASANLLTDAVGEIPGALLTNALLKNDAFQTQFINRFADHLNTSFVPDRVVSEIDLIKALIEPDMLYHIQRWRTMGDSLDTWYENVEQLRRFAQERPGFMREQIKQEFGLNGTYQLTMQTNSSMGFVQLNSIDIIEETPGIEDASNWSGIYFTGVPIVITAHPRPGFVFSHWEGDLVNGLRSQTIHLIPNGDVFLTAVFTSDN